MKNPQDLDVLLSGVLVQLTLILLAARFCGSMARRVGQPRAMGEIIAGLLLGPSLLGKLAPEAFEALFRAGPATPMMIISQIGLILLMFQVGLEFDFVHLRERRNRIAVYAITAAGMLLPFGLGLAFALASAPRVAPDVGELGYGLFMGAALSITALPILGRIMIEFGLNRTPIGVVTIAAAALTDALGWILLASIAALVTAAFAPKMILGQIGMLAAYCAACWWLLRPLLRAVARRLSRSAAEPLPLGLLAILLACIFLSATITSKLGIFAIFGGFVIGVLLHDRAALVEAWRQQVGRFVTVFFLPIFFTYTGLRTDIGQLQTPEAWAWCAGLIGLATAGKFGGCYLAARIAGLHAAEARVVAIMMNTRGLMDLIVVNLGYDLGVIPGEVFTMLVLMAIASTLMTAPCLRLWLPRIGHSVLGRADA